MSNTNFNPDVLSCLANLSSDEVFTPPNLVNEILDLLPTELWNTKDSKFLDPVCKTGVFLREIAKRLDKGLEKQITNKQKRVNHIFKNQLFGIAITELTSLTSRRSLYCSKTANGKYSICDGFNDEQGNIKYEKIKHSWKNGNCTYCGASQAVYERDDKLEAYAYNFIHTDKPEEIFNMKFDVIVGNPPYQLSDAGYGRSASPIYHYFVQQAKKMNPRYLIMIIPSRWFTGGKGLNEFRNEMLNDNRIRKLVDFENSSDIFPGVDVAGGICYFLWDRDNLGPCEVTTTRGDKSYIEIRPLNDFPIFIRDSIALPIVRKVLSKNGKEGKYLNAVVSKSKPFGLRTFYKPKSKGIPCWFIQKIGLKFANESDINDELGLLKKWKLLIPKAPIAGQTDFSKPVKFYYEANTRIAKPGECCTESWIVACAFSTKSEVISFKSYLFTKIVRFLLLQTVISQDVTRKNFSLIPDLGKYEGEYTDKMLLKRWGITEEEWNYIDSRIS